MEVIFKYAKLIGKDRSRREVVLDTTPHLYWLSIIIITRDVD